MKNKKFLKALASFMLSGAAAVGCFAMFGCGHSHTYSDEWKNDAEKHWHDATCEHTDEKGDEAAHEFDSNGKCVVCDYQKPKPAKHSHTLSSDWKVDANEHWKECTDPGCDDKGVKLEKGKHTLNEEGTECIVCHKEIEGGEEGDDPATVLATAKTNAKASLANYVNADDYTTNAGALAAAISAGNTAIDAATTTEGVATALANAKAAIDEIKSDAELGGEEDPAAALATAKTNAKASLANYVNANDYTTNADALEAAISAGNTAIDAATTTEGVATALANAKSAIDEIKSDATLAEEAAAEALATAKTNAKAQLANYVDADDYIQNADLLEKAISDGNTAIDAATTTEGVATALANAKAAIDDIKSDATLAEEAAAAAAAALAKAKTDAKAELAAYKNASDYTANAEAFAAAISDGNDAIDAATTTETVATALENAKTAIDDIKADAQYTMHEKFELLGGDNEYTSNFTTDATVPYWNMQGMPGGQIVGNISTEDANDYTETNKVEISGGSLQVIDNSNQTTYANVLLFDFDDMNSILSNKIVNVYAKIKATDDAGSWSLFSLVTIGDNGGFKEIVAVRSPERTKLGLTVNGTASANTIKFEKDKDIEILISVNLASGTVIGYLNNTRILFGENDSAKIDASINSLVGVRLQTAGSASRSLSLSALEVTSSDVELADLKTALKGRLTSVYNSYDLENYTENGTVLTKAHTDGLAAIDAAEDKEGMLAAYNEAINGMSVVQDDVAVALSNAKQAAIDTLNSYKTGEKYETNQEEADELIQSFIEQIGYAPDAESLENVVKAAKQAIRPLVADCDVHITYMLEGQELFTEDLYSGDNAEPAKAPEFSGKKFVGWYDGENKYQFPETWAENTTLNLTAQYEYLDNEELHQIEADSAWSVAAEDAGSVKDPQITSNALYTINYADTSAVYKAVTTTVAGKSFKAGLESSNINANTTGVPILITANDYVTLTVYAAISDNSGTGKRFGTLAYCTPVPDEEGNYTYTDVHKIDEELGSTKKYISGSAKISLLPGETVAITASIGAEGSRLWLLGVEATYSEAFINATVVYHDAEGNEFWKTGASTLSTLERTEPENEPEKQNHVFKGWTNVQDGDTPVDLSTLTYSAGDTIDLYPVFQEVNNKITFVINGDEQEVPYIPGDEVTAPTVESELGKLFLGWLDDDDNEVTDFTTLTGNPTLTANIIDYKYKLTYIIDESAGSKNEEVYLFVVGGKLVNDKKVETALRDGKDMNTESGNFAYWQYDVEGVATKFELSATSEGIQGGDYTLTAKLNAVQKFLYSKEETSVANKIDKTDTYTEGNEITSGELITVNAGCALNAGTVTKDITGYEDETCTQKVTYFLQTKDLSKDDPTVTLLTIAAHKNVSVKLYLLSGKPGGIDTTRKGNYTYKIGEGTPVSVDAKGTSKVMTVVSITLNAGETVTVTVTCTETGSNVMQTNICGIVASEK